jgi:hypothetical protein
VAEACDLPEGQTLGQLRDLLIARGGPHAEALARGRAVRCAINQAMADESAVLTAMVPKWPSSHPSPAADPVARVSIQTQDFDLGAEAARLRAGDSGVGAVASFVGTVRERSDGQRGQRDGTRALPRHDRGRHRGHDRRGAGAL